MPFRQLNLLFCGSDEFSIRVLHKLYEYTRCTNSVVGNIDVLCRQCKKVGRGLKLLRQVPLYHVAQQIGFPVYQTDNLQTWQPLKPIDLIITASFGLRIPQCMLSRARYGGVNLHPSMLPDLRGASPVHRALLLRRPFTGVTLQILNDNSLDTGTILRQTAYPGIPITWNPAALSSGSMVNRTTQALGEHAGEMLVNFLKDKAYTENNTNNSNLPVINHGWDKLECTRQNYLRTIGRIAHADRISPADSKVNWDEWSADEIILRCAVLGDVWDTLTWSRCRGYRDNPSDKTNKRVIFRGLISADPLSKIIYVENAGQLLPYDQTMSIIPGSPCLINTPTKKFAIITRDAKVLCASSITIEGSPSGHGEHSLTNWLLRRLPQARDHHELFREPRSTA